MTSGIVWGSLVSVALVMVAPCGMGQTTNKLVANLDANRPQVIVAYGTSLTEGGAWVKQVGAALDSRYPHLATLVNSGGSGMWSDWGVQNLEARVIQKKPDAVFIEFCINDSVERFHCTVEHSRQNLETMIERILKGNPECEIILMTMTPGDGPKPGEKSYRKDIGQYNDMYRAVAKKHGLLLIDHYPNWKKLEAKDPNLFHQYVPDTIHPTAAGCSEVVTPVILKALGISAGAKPEG